jgi:hypothetical protein
MNVRGLILGFLGVFLLAGLAYFNDQVVHSGSMISSLMPVVGFGMLVFFAMLVQPLLRAIGGKAPLSGREVAVIFGLFLLAAGIPGLGLVRYMPPAMMFPHQDVKTRAGWAAEHVVEIAPKRMLADVSGDDSRALEGYVTGLAEGRKHISPKDVPWHAWIRPLVFWVPLVLCAVLALLGLATVFHTQWAHHEQLPYPITTFTKALLPQGRGLPEVFRNRLFWWGFGAVFAIELNNYLLRYWGEILIPIRLSFDFSAFATKIPVFVKGAGSALFRPRIQFAVVALAYFLPSTVSFSMAFFPFVYATIFGICAGYGIPFRCGRMLGPSIEQSIYAGGYMAITLMMLYTGRYYYWHVLRRGLGFRSSEKVEDHAVWGMRVFLLCSVLFIGQLVAVGLDWQLAIVYTGLMYMVHVVISRMIVETGGFSIGTYVYPGVMIWTFMGTAALGPRTMLIMFLVSTILVSGPGWAPMPFFVQALNLADVSKVKVGRMAKTGIAVVILALVVALATTIYWQYDQGAPTRGWPRSTSWFSFENMLEIKQTLRGQGLLQQAEQVHGWARFKHISPLGQQTSAFFIALALALIVGLGRLRFAWWPFHPMAFVFLGGWPGYYHYFSFFLGWLIKGLVTRYGGGKTYQQLKPVMIGVLAGTMLGKLVPMIVGPIVYFAGGQ